MARKKWVVRKYDKETVSAMAEELNISPYAALLANVRGINNADSAREFFGMKEPQENSPMDFPDMGAAVKRIQKALDNFERIAVYGDYDADGVTSTTLLYSYLEMQGADVIYCVPDRHNDGYGLSNGAVDKISNMGAKLIITVDNGISAIKEADYIKQLGMDMIVTDHHIPSDKLPDAVAVVDPHRKDCSLNFCDYAGVGVAYKLICALEGEENEVTESFLDLVTIGTIADVMPLVAENRQIVRRGIPLIDDSERAGIQALKEAAGVAEKKVMSSSVSFCIAPRINAAGRMGSAERAIKLLLSEDYDEALEIANEINEANISRQQTEQDIFAQADEKISNQPEWKYDRVIVVDGKGWHDGVIGIVASRIVEKYGKPAMVITTDGEESKGSGRSVDGFNLYQALCSCSDILTHFGGHKLAAGIGIENDRIDDFRKAINAYADGLDYAVPVQYIDFKINPTYANTEILSVISSLEPFGTANPQPVFGLYNMVISDIQPISNGKHLKITLRRDNTSISALKFKATQLDFPFCVGDAVDVAATFEANEYLGQIRLSTFIKNIKIHGTDDDILFERMEEYTSVMREKYDSVDVKNVLPDRNQAAEIYKLIRSRNKWRFDTEMLCFRLGWSVNDYAKVAVALEALTQLGTIVRDEEGNYCLPQKSEKVNFDDAPIIVKIKNHEH